MRRASDLIVEKIKQDPILAVDLLHDGIEMLLRGEVDAGRFLLRDYINGTIGFQALAKATGIGDKSLMRMFGAEGNPRADNLFAVLRALQELSEREVRVEVRSRRAVTARAAKRRVIRQRAVKRQ